MNTADADGIVPFQPGRRNPLHAKIIRQRADGAIRRDLRLKEIAAEIGVNESTAAKYAARLGYRRMYVTASERAAVMASRRGKAAT